MKLVYMREEVCYSFTYMLPPSLMNFSDFYDQGKKEKKYIYILQEDNLVTVIP